MTTLSSISSLLPNLKIMFQENNNRNVPAIIYLDQISKIKYLQYELKKSKAEHKLCVKTIEELKFLILHKVRQSICQIISLSGLLSKATCPRNIKSLTVYIEGAAVSLDLSSKSMTRVIEHLEDDNAQ